MRKIVVSLWVSIDGRIAGPNGELDWLLPDEQMGDYELKLVHSSDVLLLGRSTYDDFAAHWPHVGDESSEFERAFACRVNEMRKVVISGSSAETAWHNTERYATVDRDQIADLRAEPGQDILVYGSGTVVRALTNLGLVDEYHLLVHPVVLGAGQRLFDTVDTPIQWELISAGTFATGVSQLKYRPR
jgi:dihydrofolate reductase